MTYEELKEYLYGLRHHGAKYGIDRMRLLDARLGSPWKAYPTIHIAGTNGKGSTSAMLEAILKEAGLKVGLFTSPHIIDLSERIQVDGKVIGEGELLKMAQRLIPVAREIGRKEKDDHPSFFEFVTAMGLLYFKEQEVDIAIVETGLGGEKDSSNVISPLVSIITSIGYDHRSILGETLEEIAMAKAGIIKSDTPVVIGSMPSEAEAVVRTVAQNFNAPVVSVREQYKQKRLAYPETNLVGEHQRLNAAGSVLAAEVVKGYFSLKPESVRSGLMSVRCPARWQKLNYSDRLDIILDTAHNRDSIRALCETLKDLGEKPHLVYGSLNKEDSSESLRQLEEYVSDINLVKPKNFRGVDPQTLKEALSLEGQARASIGNLRRVTELLRSEGGKARETYLVCGSIYLIGEILESLYPGKALGEILV